MEPILFVNACVRGEQSRTLRLARHFLKTYAALHPDKEIYERDLCARRLEPQYPEVLAERDRLWEAGKFSEIILLSLIQSQGIIKKCAFAV